MVRMLDSLETMNLLSSTPPFQGAFPSNGQKLKNHSLLPFLICRSSGGKETKRFLFTQSFSWFYIIFKGPENDWTRISSSVASVLMSFVLYSALLPPPENDLLRLTLWISNALITFVSLYSHPPSPSLLYHLWVSYIGPLKCSPCVQNLSLIWLYCFQRHSNVRVLPCLSFLFPLFWFRCGVCLIYHKGTVRPIYENLNYVKVQTYK